MARRELETKLPPIIENGIAGIVSEFRTKAINLCKQKADGYRQGADGNLARETWVDRAEVMESFARELEQLK